MIPDPQNTEIGMYDQYCLGFHCWSLNRILLKTSTIQIGAFTCWLAPLPMVVQIGVTRWHEHLCIDSTM